MRLPFTAYTAAKGNHSGRLAPQRVGAVPVELFLMPAIPG